MKIPERIKIGNRLVRVKFSREPFNDDAYGWYDANNFTILLSSRDQDSNPTTIAETFWHELMHAINDFNRFSIEMQREMDDKDTPETDAYKFEEMITERTAKTLLQVLQDNPDLIKATN
ncbi:MAG: hypothetical protein P1P85_04250 [Patescibacteria group bacterium]|nr:hypothetical protein [Patescibacteria group bacterium]